MPRKRPNSRVKDLPDLALLGTAQALDAKRLRTALEQTFTFRKTHALPATLPDPSPAWQIPYAAMAREDQLAWPTLDEVTKVAQAFLDPVLAGDLDAVWRPATWTWSAR
jgi:Nucleotidyl transferase AbiEii toxin, Type IV TA system